MADTQIYRRYRQGYILLIRLIDFMNNKNRTKENIPFGSQILWLNRQNGQVTIIIEDQ